MCTMRASLVCLDNISTFQGTRLVAGFALGHVLTHGCAWTPGMGEAHIHDYPVVLRIYSDLHANAVLVPYPQYVSNRSKPSLDGVLDGSIRLIVVRQQSIHPA